MNVQQSSQTSSSDPTTATRLHYSPHVDICDDGSELTVVADVPGAKAEAIDIRYDDGVLSLHAPVAARQLPGRLVRQEYGIGDYRRSFRLGEGFDPSRITAAAQHGVLTIRIPRLAATQPRKINVTSA